MGCVFCASGLDGVVRNLTTGEILEQMLQLERLLPPGERLSHIVVMGMGEPLANLDRLLPALAEAIAAATAWASAPGGSRSRPSACRRRIRRLADEDHASTTWPSRCTPPTTSCATGSCRPTRRSASTAILAAADDYFEKTGPAGDVRVRAAGRRERPAGTRRRVGRRCCRAARRW